MAVYVPDNWVVVHLKGDTPHYRVLAGWSGGYLDGDSWRANSGITKVDQAGDYFLFYGSSGSCYECHKDTYRLRKNNAYVWESWKLQLGDAIEMMPEDTDWLAMDWIIN